MDNDKIKNAVEHGAIEWSLHSLEVMFERGITRKAVKYVMINGEIIEDYPHEKPFPSVLMFGFWEKRPLHVVLAFDEKNEKAFVITAYEPDKVHFESNYKTRRKP